MANEFVARKGLISLSTSSFYGPVNFSGSSLVGVGTGSVLFTNASGSVTGSSNLFWDNTNARLGVGTSSPAYDFDLVKTSATAVIGRIRNLSADGYSTLTISNDLGQVANYSIFGSIW